jgi:hypothetical protein
LNGASIPEMDREFFSKIITGDEPWGMAISLSDQAATNVMEELEVAPRPKNDLLLF